MKLNFAMRCLMIHSGSKNGQLLRKLHIGLMIVCSSIMFLGHLALYPTFQHTSEVENHLNYINYSLYYSLLPFIWMQNAIPLERYVELAKRNVYTYPHRSRIASLLRGVYYYRHSTPQILEKCKTKILICFVYTPYVLTFIGSAMRLLSLNEQEVSTNCFHYLPISAWHPFAISTMYACWAEFFFQAVYYGPLGLCTCANVIDPCVGWGNNNYLPNSSSF